MSDKIFVYYPEVSGRGLVHAVCANIAFQTSENRPKQEN